MEEIASGSFFNSRYQVFLHSLKQNKVFSVIQSEELIKFKSKFQRRCIMSKFFVQFLLSLAVAVSAAVGFSPNMRGEVNQALREAKSFAHGVTQPIFHRAAGVEADVDVSAEAAGEMESRIESDLEADLDFDQAVDSRSQAEVEASLSAESDVKSQAESNKAKLDLENEIESQLDLEVGIGN